MTNLKDIIPHIAEGKTNREIAKIYKVSPVTVASWIGKLKKAGIEIPYRKTGRPTKYEI